MKKKRNIHHFVCHEQLFGTRQWMNTATLYWLYKHKQYSFIQEKKYLIETICKNANNDLLFTFFQLWSTKAFIYSELIIIKIASIHERLWLINVSFLNIKSSEQKLLHFVTKHLQYSSRIGLKASQGYSTKNYLTFEITYHLPLHQVQKIN